MSRRARNIVWLALAAIAIAWVAVFARHISELNNRAWDRYIAYKDHMAECVPKLSARRCQELWDYVVPANRRRL